MRVVMTRHLPGLILTLILGVASWFVSGLHASLDALVVGLLIGIIVKTIIGNRQILEPGLLLSPKFFIPLGIILYGVNLEFAKIISIPAEAIVQMIAAAIVVMWIVYSLGNFLKIKRQTALLIGIGTAVCGASAIVMAAPAVDADNEDTTTSLLVITVVGVFGLATSLLLLKWLDLSTGSYAVYCGTTLPQTGLVKTAAGWLGTSTVSLALSYKMFRIISILILIPIAGLLSKFTSAQEIANFSGSMKINIPWFLWAFVVVGILFSAVPWLHSQAHTVKPISAFAWTTAMVSVGLMVNIKKIFKKLAKPLLLGFIAWVGILAIFLFGLCCMGY